MVWLALLGILSFIIIVLTTLWLFIRYKSGYYSVQTSLSDKTIVITGATSGIGLETARELASAQARLYLLSRDLTKGASVIERLQEETGNKEIHLVECDLCSLASVRRCAEHLLKTLDKIDVLINNAGRDGNFVKHPVLTEDGLEETMAANYFGHFLLTNLLLERLKASAPSRIVNVSSVMHHFGNMDVENLNWQRGGYGRIRAYCRSKLANVLFTKELARRLCGTEVTVNALHPGIVLTDIARRFHPFFRILIKYFGPVVFKTAREGAHTTVYLAVSPDIQDLSGFYFADCKRKASSSKSCDPHLARRLWEESEALTGLN